MCWFVLNLHQFNMIHIRLLEVDRNFATLWAIKVNGSAGNEYRVG